MKFVLFLLCSAALMAAPVTVHWDKVVRVSKTTATLQVVVNPPLRPGSKIHDRVYTDLRALGADYVRYVPWLPYPKLAVAELEPPAAGKTSWDFSLIDPMTIDFLEATEGHPAIPNFSTIPQWMFKTAKPVPYPADPDKPVWNYTQGTELRDPSMKELGDYYARLVSWYTAGGFTDELGVKHNSGHHYKIDYWEIFNEVEFEHNTTPEQYTARYDAIAGAIHKVAPQMKFVGMALAGPSQVPKFFEYFLNPNNHKPGIPLDMISYHFYASPQPDETPEIQQHTYFTQADGFLNYRRLHRDASASASRPPPKPTIDEIGSISAEDGAQGEPGYVFKPDPQLLLEPLRRDLRLRLRAPRRDGHRHRRREPAGRLPDAVPQRQHGRLGDRRAQRPLPRARASQEQLRPRRQARRHRRRAPVRLRPGLRHHATASTSCC